MMPDEYPLEPLPDGSVDVWQVQLDRERDRLQVYKDLLSPDERESAHRFRSFLDRDRYTVGRGVLRSILARYLGQAPESLRFAYGARGKPAIAEPMSRDLHFNLSHSGEIALVAVSTGCRVGVDVEQLPSATKIDRLRGLALCQAELTLLSRLSGTARSRVFAELWSRKEAYVKADGRGLAGRLCRLDASAGSGRLLELDPDSRRWVELSSWSVLDLPVPTGYAGALAAERTAAINARQGDASPRLRSRFREF